jgi:hypothetical protein
MVDNDIKNHRQLIDKLVKHCKERASGTIFFNLPAGQSARLVLKNGVIHWVAYEQLRGTKAIESIREVDQARFNFNPSLKLAIGDQQLPPTSDILKRLYKHNNKPVTEDDLPFAKEGFSSVNIQANVSGDSHLNLDRVRQVLEEEALEYLGPMGKVLCADYLKSMPPQLSLIQVRQVIASLKHDINDERKGQLFMTRVKKELNIH